MSFVLGVETSKTRPKFQSKQGSFGFQVYIATILIGSNRCKTRLLFFSREGAPPRTNFHCQVAASVFSKQKDRRCLEGSARKNCRPFVSFRVVVSLHTVVLFSIGIFCRTLNKKGYLLDKKMLLILFWKILLGRFFGSVFLWLKLEM